MDEFMVIPDEVEGIRDFLDNILVPSLVIGYFVSLIQKMNASTAVFDTYLFVAHYFLSTGNASNSIFLLFMEISCILPAYVYASNNVLVCLLIGMMLSLWKMHFRLLGVHHPRILVNKCMILLLFKYALAVPEYIITIYWIAKVMYKYIFYYERKSSHDVYLFTFIAAILHYIAFSLDTHVGGRILVFFPGKGLLFWLIMKADYHQ